MSSPELYRLERVVRRYGDRTVLDIDHLRVGTGDLVCLMGPTGAGKSTLLRLLAGLEPPSAGTLKMGAHLLDGHDLPVDVQRRITLVFQRPILMSGSVLSNVEYGLRVRGVRPPYPQARAILERLGLGHLLAQSTAKLSGGEAQLTGLARALVLQPEVLLLDEPTAHLDPARVALVEEVIREAHGALGSTILWATHNLFQARRVAQRIAFILDGRLIETAPTEQFFSNPQDPRSAAFIRGEMVC